MTTDKCDFHGAGAFVISCQCTAIHIDYYKIFRKFRTYAILSVQNGRRLGRYSRILDLRSLSFFFKVMNEHRWKIVFTYKRYYYLIMRRLLGNRFLTKQLNCFYFSVFIGYGCRSCVFGKNSVAQFWNGTAKIGPSSITTSYPITHSSIKLTLTLMFVCQLSNIIIRHDSLVCFWPCQ